MGGYLEEARQRCRGSRGNRSQEGGGAEGEVMALQACIGAETMGAGGGWRGSARSSELAGLRAGAAPEAE